MIAPEQELGSVEICFHGGPRACFNPKAAAWRSSRTQLAEELKTFRERDLSKENILYLFLDGTYVKYRVQAERKEPVLVAYGIREDGKKVLLHVGPGHRE